MQTISLPYRISEEDAAWIADAVRMHSCIVRAGYAHAGTIRVEKDLRDFLKASFPKAPTGSWGVHCATLEALRLRHQRPDGRMVFGGRAALKRRTKGLITNDEWRLRRHSRPIEIVGDRTRGGNRHLKLSIDARTATVSFLGKSATLHLPAMSGKTGRLLKALARLTKAGEMSVTFRLSIGKLSLSFDPMDLRRLPPGETLESVKRAERDVLGRKSRGRPRKDPGTHYAANRIRPIAAAERPIHPEWRNVVPMSANRAVGIDLNPQWIGLSVVEIGSRMCTRNPDAVCVLDHHLIRLNVPIDAAPEAFTALMATVARAVVSLARRWSAATIVHEDGLGKLRWSKKSHGPAATQTINHWSRNALIGGLARRCALSGLTFYAVWGGYSTTVGNTCFNLPDACASAAEIARRGIAASRGNKDCLPVVPPRVRHRLWKDGVGPESIQIDDAGRWKAIHRAAKSSPLGGRRPHPRLQGVDPGILVHAGRGYAVRRDGSGKGGQMTTAKIVNVRVA